MKYAYLVLVSFCLLSCEVKKRPINGVLFTKAQLGRKWPLTVADSVYVRCEGSGQYYLVTTASGVTYAMNGTAKGTKKWPPLDDVISRRDTAGYRIVGDTQPFFEAAYKKCK